MKTLLLIILLFISIKAAAPGTCKYLYVQAGEKLSEFDALIKAVVWVESKGNTFAFNPVEDAVGAFQIRQCRIDDYNRRTGSNYRIEDCFDYNLSREVFLYFAKGKSFEQAAKNWNGSGKQTIEYWNKVKINL
jgi:hypothetical protein